MYPLAINRAQAKTANITPNVGGHHTASDSSLRDTSHDSGT